jgi:hypothetical protein
MFFLSISVYRLLGKLYVDRMGVGNPLKWRENKAIFPTGNASRGRGLKDLYSSV